MKWVYHDPNKSLQKLVIKPGEFMVPRLDTQPTLPGALPQDFGGLGSRPALRGRPKKKKPIDSLKRGFGSWL